MVEELRQWGNWARHDPNRLRYQSPWLILMRGKVEENGEQAKRKALSYTIDDDVAMQIDKAVTLLGRFDPMLHALVVLKYYDRRSMKEISEMSQRLDKGFGKAQGWNMLAQAEKFIEGQLYALEYAV